MAPLVTFVQDGLSIDYTPGSAVSAGDVVLQGDLLGVAKKDIAANALGALAVSGVLKFPKEAGASTAIAVGVLVYWDVSESVADDSSDTGTNKLLGKCVLATVDADTTVLVLMSQ